MSEFAKLIEKQFKHPGKPSRHMPLMHWVRPADSGPLVSDGGPSLPPEMASQMNREQVGTPGTYRVACDSTIALGVLHGGTGKTFLVNCPKCMATKEFAEQYEPSPRDGAELERISLLNLDRLEHQERLRAARVT